MNNISILLLMLTFSGFEATYIKSKHHYYTKNKFISSLISASLAFSVVDLCNAADSREAYKYLYQGMNEFKTNKVEDSINSFKQAELEYQPISKKLWQKGISQYYVKDYNGCFNQFVKDIPSNPNDTEEVVWAIMRSYGMNDLTTPSTIDPTVNIGTESKGHYSDSLKAEINKLIFQYTRIEDDPRPIMRVVQALFVNTFNLPTSLPPHADTTDTVTKPVYDTSTTTTTTTAQRAVNEALEALQSLANSDNKATSPSDYFYANLYLSLYYSQFTLNGKDSNSPTPSTTASSIQRDRDEYLKLAIMYGDRAAESPYAVRGRDYMTAVARVNRDRLLRVPMR